MLAELKIIGAGVSWYPRGVDIKGVDKRADGLDRLYRNKLKSLDRKYHQTNQDQIGPLENRFDSYGKLNALVVGASGEGSKDLHVLIRVMAESRVMAVSQARGHIAGDGELSTAIGSIRRVLSCSIGRAQALCLVSRIGQIGDLARGAAERRAAAVRAEHIRKEEARFNWVANVRGRGLSRVGEIFIP